MRQQAVRFAAMMLVATGCGLFVGSTKLAFIATVQTAQACTPGCCNKASDCGSCAACDPNDPKTADCEKECIWHCTDVCST